MLWESEIIAALWIGFAVYWLISATTIKKNKKNNLWVKSIGLRIAIIVVVFVIFKSHIGDLFGQYQQYQFPLHNPTFGVIGVLIAFLGMICAFWARITIGKNWGQPMTQKEMPELVTSGPYTYVRHPIYAGVIVAMIGTLLVEGIVWFIVLVVVSVYFFISARIEEKNLLKTFPEKYPKYMQQTKMLIPFVL